jgi:hypothetical protein
LERVRSEAEETSGYDCYRCDDECTHVRFSDD